jgi:hypothetical protein
MPTVQTLDRRNVGLRVLKSGADRLGMRRAVRMGLPMQSHRQFKCAVAIYLFVKINCKVGKSGAYAPIGVSNHK